VAEILEYFNKAEKRVCLVKTDGLFYENQNIVVSFEDGNKTCLFHKRRCNQFIDLLSDCQFLKLDFFRELETLKITAVIISTTYFNICNISILSCVLLMFVV
jgi:hypothetical protein